jgi:hypothetical protein
MPRIFISFAAHNSRGPKTGTIPIRAVNSMHLLRHVKGLIRAAQDSTATAQGCLLMAQVKTASAQAWKRKWHLVRSFFADDYCAKQFDWTNSEMKDEKGKVVERI